MADTWRLIGTAGIVFLGALAAALAGVVLFGFVPAATEVSLLGVVLILVTTLAGVRLAGNVAGSVFPGYNVAEVRVDGPIVQRSSGGLGPGPDEAAADDVVEQIERADDSDARALIVQLDTPGGLPVASDDIRQAVADFDGPTVAYAKSLCASGGYMIACGADEFFAREDAIVGSIGVIANQTKFADLADRYGIERERFTGGEYKDTLDPFKPLDDDERSYFQGVVDSGYESFVELVAESRGLDPAAVRDTEARVYHASQALDAGLVDAVGSRADLEERLTERTGLEEVAVEEFEPEQGIANKVSLTAQRVAHAFGRGVSSVLVDRDGPLVQYRR